MTIQTALQVGGRSSWRKTADRQGAAVLTGALWGSVLVPGRLHTCVSAELGLQCAQTLQLWFIECPSASPS